jgi:hypothetical protein
LAEKGCEIKKENRTRSTVFFFFLLQHLVQRKKKKAACAWKQHPRFRAGNGTIIRLNKEELVVRKPEEKAKTVGWGFFFFLIARFLSGKADQPAMAGKADRR